jgi:protein tyrosine phosphatase type 4A
LNKALQTHNTVCIVRACEGAYNEQLLNVPVIDLQYQDGSVPDKEVIRKWLGIVKSTFHQRNDVSIGVHCVAGLGRAPLLVCLALIELGMKNTEAIETVRNARPNALNTVQVRFVCSYKKKKNCIIM